MATTTSRTLGSIVDLEGGQISREIFVNEDIYAQEQEQVFAKAWLFVGHESQIPKPGTTLCPAWARSRSSCAATARGRYTSS